MDGKTNLDLKTLKFIFNKNKPYIAPIVVMLACVILLFQFVIPQFNSLLKIQKETKELSLELEVLKKNLDVLANTDEEVLNSQVEILSLALPQSKDFIGILDSMYSAAQRTGISLGNFSFKVGDISTAEGGNNYPVVKLSIPVNASAVAINSFVEAMSKSIPLSEVYSVKIGSTSSTVDLSFYYKSLAVSDFGQNANIIPVSQKALMLVSQLNDFRSSSAFSAPPVPIPTESVATSSARQ